MSDGVFHLDVVFFHHYVPVVTQVAKHVSDLGNQHNNGPHQGQNFDNPSALCLALWAKSRIRLRGGGGGGGGGGGMMHAIGSL